MALTAYAQCRACNEWGYDIQRARCVQCGASAHAAAPHALTSILDGIAQATRRESYTSRAANHDLDVLAMTPTIELRTPDAEG
jgi:hypothetical protein